jgi:hypothetical protein
MVKSTSPAKANATLPKHSSPPQNKYKQIGSPKKDNNGEKVKDIHKIYPLSEADGTPYGWAFLGFFDVKEWIKSMCNREGRTTTLGNKEFKPFTNLTIIWILHLSVADKLWVIKIDATMTETEGSFPMVLHVPFANKIARAVLSTDLQWEAGSLDIAPIILTEEQEKELNMHFSSSVTPSAIRSHELFLEQIAETDKDIESQL